MIRKIITAAIFWSVLCLLPGCLNGNGEGVGGAYNGPQGVPSGTGASPGTGTAGTSPYNGWPGTGLAVPVPKPPAPLIYYNMDPNDVCLVPSMGLNAYRKQITVAADGSATLADVCAGTSQILPGGSFDQSAIYPLIGYQSDIYELRTSLPLPSDLVTVYAQVFCQSASGGSATPSEVAVRINSSTPNPSGYASQEPFLGTWATLNQDVSASNQGNQREYQGAGFTLTIDLGSAAQAPYKFPATLQISGEASPHDVNCRIVQ